MKTLPRLLLLASLLPALTACVQLADVDATRSPRFATMLGQEFELKEPLLVRGVKHDARATTPDYALVMPSPGIGGRFIVDLGTLPRGTRFRIVGVTTHRASLFPSTRYVISLLDRSLPGAAGREILLSDAASWHLYLEPTSADAAPRLNERFFRPLPSSPASSR